LTLRTTLKFFADFLKYLWFISKLLFTGNGESGEKYK